jgi:hypothetical protein
VPADVPAEDVDVGAEIFHSTDQGVDDTELVDELDAPGTPEDIYEEEASAYRPISTGDIFEDVTVPGCAQDDTPHERVMVLAHPSAMRKGATVVPLLRAAPVVSVEGLSKTKWPGGARRGHYDTYPLPLLARFARSNGFELEEAGWGARVDLAAPIQADALDVHRRLVCLSPVGLHLLLQRVVHCDTRAAVKLSTLAETFEPKLNELEMLYDWNETLVPRRIDAGGDLVDELLKAANEFEDVMTTQFGDATIRAMLEHPKQAGAISRVGEAYRHFNATLRARASI